MQFSSFFKSFPSGIRTECPLLYSSEHPIKDQGIYELILPLRENTTVRIYGLWGAMLVLFPSLLMAFCGLKFSLLLPFFASFSDNQIEDEGVASLVEALAVSTSVQKLMLDRKVSLFCIFVRLIQSRLMV